MKAVAVLLLSLVVCCQANVLIQRPIVYSAAPAAQYDIELEQPVLTTTNLHVFTDDDDIATTEIKSGQYGAFPGAAQGSYSPFDYNI